VKLVAFAPKQMYSLIDLRHNSIWTLLIGDKLSFQLHWVAARVFITIFFGYLSFSEGDI
jgi:hypothetical protein